MTALYSALAPIEELRLTRAPNGVVLPPGATCIMPYTLPFEFIKAPPRTLVEVK